ncbi:MAG: hypothetical protein IPK76_12820 [Lewinellaceae bacterium]|nr:hypothetical protein [Lewinellaceae bacterium]
MLEGEMTLVTLPSREALFFLKKAGESDYDIFLCQGTELSSAAQKELGKVKVAYLREALAIETSEGDIYTFTIGSRKGHEIIQKVVPYWSGKGYGLALNNNRADGPLDYKGLSSTDDLRASSCKCRLYHDPNDDSDCDSGGIGASSCSIGGTSTDPGCSVSCASDVAGSTYYACCQTE